MAFNVYSKASGHLEKIDKLELSNFGVEEMSQNEMVKTEGGGLLGGLLTSLLTAVSTVAGDTLQYAGKQVKTIWTLLGSLL